MKVWEETIKDVLAIEGLDSNKYSEKRSALRKALTLCLEGTSKNWQNSEWVERFWKNGSWSKSISLTRPSASGIAACFGNATALVTQMYALHVLNSDSYNAPGWLTELARLWSHALIDPTVCASSTRGSGRVFGLHEDWDRCDPDDADGRANETFIDIALMHAKEHWGIEVFATPKGSPTSAPTAKQPVSSAVTDALDALLSSADMPSVSEIGTMRTDLGSLTSEVEELREKLSSMPTTSVMAPVSVQSDGAIPSGTVTMKPAHEAFGITGKDVTMFDMPVPVGEWDGVHPHIPEKDEDYVFDSETLVPVLLAITHGRIPWLKGHTGTGKTTLIEQVYARLQLPLFRLNLDSDITRGELVGREVLRTDGDGHTVTEFVEGIIPMAMQQPCGLLLDEIDASRPDLGFVLQRLTEGKGFMLLEDGGRTIAPHPHFRMFATANTNGRGDETGLYSGTRALGTAFVNRFKPYLEVDYMSQEEEAQLIREKVPAIDANHARSIAAYATEHRVAFKQADVTLACSPRDTLAFALAAVEYQRSFGTTSAFLKLALQHSILNAADSDDRQVLEGLAERVFTTKSEG